MQTKENLSQTVKDVKVEIIVLLPWNSCLFLR